VAGHLVKRRPPLLRGYRVKILDGNHLAKTEHRLKELRTIGAGPLPGHALVVLEPDVMLATDVFPCEDAHAQERTLLPQVLPRSSGRTCGSRIGTSAPRTSCLGLWPGAVRW